jgi:hypothetical protein
MGLILEAKGQHDWIITHTSACCAIHLEGDEYRIYFHGRNEENQSQPGFIEVDLANPKKILNITAAPLVKVGKPGLFDDSGVLGPWLVDSDGRAYMYYSGWTRGVSVPYYSAVGLAISNDGGKTFKKYSDAPILDRSEIDPYMVISGCVRKEKENWQMWYSSAKDFQIMNGEPMYYYHIKYAESKDGIHWDRNGRVCIDFEHQNETRIGRPCVMKENGLYKMWYSYAAPAYRIGYAESEDGIHWIRKDQEVGIDVSQSGWDSEMLCYAFVFEHKRRKYMLYNGNEYGKTGLGYAISEE